MPTPNAPPDAAVARFRSDVLKRVSLSDGARIGVAVSGGADSLALLLLARSAFDHVYAATVDHGLRPQAAEEAAFVGSICAAMGVPHQTLKLGERNTGNLSDWARRERYAALGAWVEAKGLALLMTAHHADDQLETIIMRLNRGSGVAGLAGVRAMRGNVVRPLLGWRKVELEMLARGCGLIPVDDPSNMDDRFDRARLRKALASADWLDPGAAAHSAEALAEAEDALDWTARAYAGRRMAEKEGVVSLSCDGLPAELRRRLLLIALRAVEPAANPRGDEMDRLIKGLDEGRTATLAGVKCTGGAFWLFSAAPPHRKKRSI